MRTKFLAAGLAAILSNTAFCYTNASVSFNCFILKEKGQGYKGEGITSGSVKLDRGEVFDSHAVLAEKSTADYAIFLSRPSEESKDYSFGMAKLGKSQKFQDPSIVETGEIIPLSQLRQTNPDNRNETFDIGFGKLLFKCQILDISYDFM